LIAQDGRSWVMPTSSMEKDEEKSQR